jgi:hypothetical protein
MRQDASSTAWGWNPQLLRLEEILFLEVEEEDALDLC